MPVITTIYVKRYHKKQNAMGLCRFCPKPLAPDSKQLCEHHLLKQRQKGMEKRASQGAIPMSARRALADAVIAVFRQNPEVPLATVRKVFGVSKTVAYTLRTKAFGIPPSKAARQKALVMINENPTMPFQDIAGIAGVSMTTMYSIAKEHGIPTRARRPYKRRLVAIEARPFLTPESQ